MLDFRVFSLICKTKRRTYLAAIEQPDVWLANKIQETRTDVRKHLPIDFLPTLYQKVPLKIQIKIDLIDQKFKKKNNLIRNQIIKLKITGGHCANFSAATICTF